MTSARAARIAKTAAALRDAGLDADILQLQSNAATAAQAAAALNCRIGEIAKSLMFRRIADNAPVLALVGGDSRADLQKLSLAAGGKVQKADATFVKEKTGFEIGGVPPIGHDCAPLALMDSGMMRHQKIWAAAGSAFAVFPSSPARLAAATNAIVADIAE